MKRLPFAVGTLMAGAVVAAVAGCGATSKNPETSGFGPRPTLPAPHTPMIPTVNVVTAVGWQGGDAPTGASGTTVGEFAGELSHPRWLHVLPNGDVLVAETNAPPRPDDSKGLKGWFFGRYQAKAGGDAPSADRLTLLRDADGDGVAEVRAVFIAGLHAPFGIAAVGETIYVANTDAVLRFPYKTGATTIAAEGTKVLDLPAGPLNHHWTKNIIASADGSTLYVAIGSNSNVAENGLAEEEDRARIWQVDLATGAHRSYATGLRNPVGMAWEPTTGALWVAVNERDELGNDLVPDYMTSVQDGGFYGWPYSYYGSNVDTRVEPPQPDLVAKALVPDYALGAHTASLGLAYSADNTLPSQFAQGMFVGQHGSWNRKPRSGYKVMFVPFRDGRPDGMAVDVLTGFVTDDGDAMGRPVGVAISARGDLLVADDVGNKVWRVSGAPSTTR